MRELTITEFAHENNISVSAVYKRISRGKLKTTQGVRNNQNCTLILVDAQETGNRPFHSGPSPHLDIKTDNVQYQNEPVQDAEIIGNSTGYNIVSMENTTFETLIQNIKELAEARAQADKDSMEKVEREYLEIKAENKELRQKVEQYKIEAIEAQAELRIAKIRINELEEAISQSLNIEKKKFWSKSVKL